MWFLSGIMKGQTDPPIKKPRVECRDNKICLLIGSQDADLCMMADTGQPKVVKAVYNFKGTNNDELCFSKGDLITITQIVDGGWWEGTLEDLTGWFPSNYVKELKTVEASRAGAKSPVVVGGPVQNELALGKRESMIYYHNVVLQSMTDSERTFVTELNTLLQTFLRPMHGAGILLAHDFARLCGNLEEIASYHQALLASMDDCAKLPLTQQKIGGLFMKSAPQMKLIYTTYCANHPAAVGVLQRNKDELCKFMESKGAPSPGVMMLTTNLSKPFTRLEKYQTSLKELERHTDESHIDRGDTQRAIWVYRDLSSTCTEVRKQKEIEFDIMHSSIKGWEGEEISELGDVLLLSHVWVHQETGDKKERLLLLFPGLVVMLSMSPRMSEYIFEGKFPVSGTTVNPLEDSDNFSHAFDISGSMLDRRVVSCNSSQEQSQWVDLLREQAKLGPTKFNTKPQSLQISTSQPSISTLTQAKTALVSHQPPNRAYSTWSHTCLRPNPPLRPAFMGKEDPTKSPRSLRKTGSLGRRKPGMLDDYRMLEDDALLLKVIEAYCTSAKARHTVNSSLLDCPQVIIAEDEKIIVEEVTGNQTIVEEKTLVDTVYSLKDQIRDLRLEHRKMKKDLDEEKKARKKLENLFRKSLNLKSSTETLEDINQNLP